MELRKQIEQIYINAVFNDEAPNTFTSKILEVIGADEEQKERSSLVSRARWKYLTMVASILNDKGFTFDAKGIDIPVKYTKDLLYHVYWQTMRSVLYPGKKRLSNKEFCNLIDHVMMMFAELFEVNIPFPSMRDFMQQQEAKNM